ncbi:MAG: hypothetical protein PVF68_00980 [Acidobacteriota bacterium]|jgi:hypothetical protein
MALLEQICGLLERTYDHPALPGPPAAFVVGDDGFRRLTRNQEIVRSVDSAGTAAQVLLRHDEDGHYRLAVYFPDALIRSLEDEPPTRDLHGGNVDAFATFVEELDHLLLLATRARTGAEVSLLEMELHANVSKELVMRHFLARLAGRQRLPEEAVVWLRHHLFHKHRFVDPDLAVRARYRDAARLGLRYLEHLETVPAGRRLRDLRRFSRMTHHQKLAFLRRAA